MEVEVKVEGELMAPDTSDYGKIRNVEMKKAKNGWIVCWQTKKPRPGKSKMDHVDWTHEKTVYTIEQTDEAFNYFRTLKESEEEGDYYY